MCDDDDDGDAQVSTRYVYLVLPSPKTVVLITLFLNPGVLCIDKQVQLQTINYDHSWGFYGYSDSQLVKMVSP